MNIQFFFFLLMLLSIENHGANLTMQIHSSSGCTTPDGYVGECLNIRQCPTLLELLKRSKEDPNAVNFLKKSLCRYENKDAIVCCNYNESKITTDIPEVTSSTISSLVDNQSSDETSATVNTDIGESNTSTAEPSKTSAAADNVENDKVYQLPSPPHCGNTSVWQLGIVDGPAKLGAWPWVAALGFVKTSEKNGTIRWLCGGALITARHIITTAHCVRPIYTLVKVRLGQVDVSTNATNEVRHLEVKIEKIVKHAELIRYHHINDIAIIRLQSDVTFSENIKPICLPKTPELRKMSFLRNLPIVAGWGGSLGVQSERKVLQQIQVPVVDNEVCQRAFSNFHILPTQICAGFIQGGKGTCQDDRGSPLMWSKAGIYYVIGIVSYAHYKCAEPGYPDVYTRITSYINWIENNLN